MVGTSYMLLVMFFCRQVFLNPTSLLCFCQIPPAEQNFARGVTFSSCLSWLLPASTIVLSYLLNLLQSAAYLPDGETAALHMLMVYNESLQQTPYRHEQAQKRICYAH